MAVSTKATGHAHRILLQAMVTEKSSRLEKLNQYVFLVTKSATKQMVREAVDSVYGVRPIAVHMINLPGKWVRYGRTTGQQVGRRKAIVTLPAGKKIDVVSA